MLFKSTWWRPLKGDPIGWLVDYDNPALRYAVLTDFLERQPDVPAVREARGALGTDPVIIGTLQRFIPDHGWGSPAAPDQPIWQATADHLALLAELGVSGRDERIATAADWALDQARSPDGDYDLPGAFLWAVLRLGYHDDARIQRAVRRAAKFLVARGAPGAPIERSPWDKLPALWALLQTRPEDRERGIEAAIQTALAEVEHIDWGAVEPARLQFGFPHLGEADVLFALRVLAQAGRMTEERVKPAVTLLTAQQNERGRWPLHRNHADRLHVPVEPVGPESKWSTLNALRALKATEPLP